MTSLDVSPSTGFSGITTNAGSIKNTGFVTMGQSVKVDIIGASHLNQVCAVVPANSQIVDVILNVTTVSNDSGTAVVNVGTAADPDAFLNDVNVKALATTRGTLDTEATDIGTSDVTIQAAYDGGSADGTTGAATVTVLYLQNNNLS